MITNADASTWNCAPKRNYGKDTYLICSYFRVSKGKCQQRIGDLYLKFGDKSFRLAMLTNGVNMFFHSREADVPDEKKPRFEHGTIKLWCKRSKPFYNSPEEIRFGIYEVEPMEWSETDITHDNRPFGEKIREFGITAGDYADTEIDIPIAEYVAPPIEVMASSAALLGGIIGGIIGDMT